MAKAKKLPSGNWRIRIRTKDENKSFTAPTKLEVEKMYARYLYESQQQGPVKNDKTVKDCLSEYIEISTPVTKPKTLNGYNIILENAFPHLMNTPIGDLDDTVVQNAINIESKRTNGRTGKVISAKTVANEWGCISAALKLCAGKRFNVRLPKKQQDLTKLPEPEDIMKAFKGSEIELPVMLAMWCGLRAAEIYGLTFESIDGDFLLINKTRVTVGSERILQQSAKTDTSIRKVYMPPYVKGLIPKQTGKKTDFLINMTHSQVYLRYKKICKANNLNITFHRLRHEYASIGLTKLKLDMKTVQIQGGWKTDTTVRRIYSESYEEQKKKADKKRNKYLNSLL